MMFGVKPQLQVRTVLIDLIYFPNRVKQTKEKISSFDRIIVAQGRSEDWEQ